MSARSRAYPWWGSTRIPTEMKATVKILDLTSPNSSERYHPKLSSYFLQGYFSDDRRSHFHWGTAFNFYQPSDQIVAGIWGYDHSKEYRKALLSWTEIGRASCRERV